MSCKIKLGIIGIGNMGGAHAKNIIEGKCPDITLVALCDKSEDRISNLKQNFGEDILYFTDAIEMLDSGKIDACLVATPHYDHPKYAIECFNRNIHVMIEKPAGVYTKQVREMNETKRDVVFGLMLNQRTSSLYQKMHDLVQSKKYGEIRRVNWLITNWYRPQAYYNSNDWRATWVGEGGGVLINQCPHQLDLLQWICGMPKKVYANMHFGKWHDIEVEDDVTAYLEYENGATGVFITSTGDAKGSNRFEVQLDKAKIVVENGKLYVTEFEISEPEFTRTNTESFATPKMIELEPEEGGITGVHFGSQHCSVLNSWAGAILRGEPLFTDGTEGINGLTLSNAMHLSAFLGKEVEVPFDEELFYQELMKKVSKSTLREVKSAKFADMSSTFKGTGK